jgi:soluble P-type ATPase
VTLIVDIPGRGRLALEYLLLDVSGTLTDRGALLDGVAERLSSLASRLTVRLVSADTFGTLEAIAARLGADAVRLGRTVEKRELVEQLGASLCVVIGNGTNDSAALRAAARGLAGLGPEGFSGEAIQAADMVCRSSLEALDLLLDERALVATLRR